MRFRFRTIPFLATVAVVALGIALGNWQERRAAYKLALQQRLDARARQAPLALDGAAVDGAALEYRRVRVSGTYLPRWAVYLDNRPHGGQSGFYVLMPLQIAGTGRYVLVARGWLPRDAAERTRILPYATPTAPVTVEGIAVGTVGHVLQLGQAAPVRPGAIVQNLDAAGFAQASGLPTLPLIVEQTDAAPDTLARDWPAPSLGIDKHKGYAFQWYALAAMAALFFVITGFRSGRKQATEA